ncbi:MAG: hypothetical protein R6U20_02050 [Longimonas sp.]|uniref:hypothetical protein n=1 Tax=Longimonas sp. TaxID=2039626 RepID=UPI003976D10E
MDAPAPPDAERSPPEHALHRQYAPSDSSNTLWIGSDRGLIRFDTEHEEAEASPK